MLPLVLLPLPKNPGYAHAYVVFFHRHIFITSQVQPVEWPFAESVNSNGKNGNAKSSPASYENIANYLSQKKICLMINLPLRQHRYTPAITKGYISRRMAVEYSVPLVTDIKCAKLLVKVRQILLESSLHGHVVYFIIMVKLIVCHCVCQYSRG